MQLFAFAPLPVGVLPWNDPEPCVTVITKLTLAYGRAGFVIHAEQEPLCRAVPSLFGSDVELHHPDDFVPRKARADVLLTGSAYAAAPLPAIGARIRVGAFQKRFFALAGEHTTAIPLSAAYLRRGRRIDAEPVTVGALAPGHPERPPPAPGEEELDAEVLRRVALPREFDFDHFNVAPHDQRIDPIVPGTIVSLEGLSPDGMPASGPLPQEWPQIHALSREGKLFEIPLVCDTLWIDTDRNVCELTLRGTWYAPREVGRREPALPIGLAVGLRDLTRRAAPLLLADLPGAAKGRALFAEDVDRLMAEGAIAEEQAAADLNASASPNADDAIQAADAIEELEPLEEAESIEELEPDAILADDSTFAGDGDPTAPPVVHTSARQPASGALPFHAPPPSGADAGGPLAPGRGALRRPGALHEGTARAAVLQDAAARPALQDAASRPVLGRLGAMQLLHARPAEMPALPREPIAADAGAPSSGEPPRPRRPITLTMTTSPANRSRTLPFGERPAGLAAFEALASAPAQAPAGPGAPAHTLANLSAPDPARAEAAGSAGSGVTGGPRRPRTLESAPSGPLHDALPFRSAAPPPASASPAPQATRHVAPGLRAPPPGAPPLVPGVRAEGMSAPPVAPGVRAFALREAPGAQGSPLAPPVAMPSFAAPSVEPPVEPPRRTIGESMLDEPAPSARASTGVAPAPKPALPAIPLETYAAIKAEIWGDHEPVAPVLARRGIDEVAWYENERRLAEALAREARDGGTALAMELQRALRAAHEARPADGERPLRAFEDTYVKLLAVLDRVDDPSAAIAAKGVTAAEWRNIRRRFLARAEADERARDALAAKLAAARKAAGDDGTPEAEPRRWVRREPAPPGAKRVVPGKPG